MAREVTKTDPFGVRFDKDLLEGLKLGGIVRSPQHALNLYEKSYIELVEIKIREINSTGIIEEIPTEISIKEEISEKVETESDVVEIPKKPTMRELIALEKSKLNSKK